MFIITLKCIIIWSIVYYVLECTQGFYVELIILYGMVVKVYYI